MSNDDVDIEDIDEEEGELAIESLEISDSDHSVKCQMYDISVPIVGKLTARNDRIAVLQKQIKWIEEHYHGHYPQRRRGNTIGNNNDNVS